MPTVSRYHPLMVTLHWLIALLVIGALFMGFVVFDAIPDDAPVRKTAIALHMVGGFTVLVLMALRLVLRLRTDRPPPATSGNPVLDRLAGLIHWSFYLVVFAVIGCGIATSLSSGLPDIVFGGSKAPLPDFDTFAVFQAHGKLAWLLTGLIALHFGAALFHQLIRKDHLLRRMSFGPRV